jgi:hypothetical protein
MPALSGDQAPLLLADLPLPHANTVTSGFPVFAILPRINRMRLKLVERCTWKLLVNFPLCLLPGILFQYLLRQILRQAQDNKEIICLIGAQ